MTAYKGFETDAEVKGACEALGAILDALGFAQMAKDCRSNDGNLTRYAAGIVKHMRREKLPQTKSVESRLRALNLI